VPSVLDRDVNAARNLAQLGEAMAAGSGAVTVDGRGAREFLALTVNAHAGTAPAGYAGTGLPQGRTALTELTHAH